MSGAGPVLRWVALVLGLAACAPTLVMQEDPHGMIRVTRTLDAAGALTLTVEPTREALRVNAKSPPRVVGTDGVEHRLIGPVDATGEKLTGTASATVPRGAGTLHVSVCDSELGVCRKASVAIDA